MMQPLQSALQRQGPHAALIGELYDANVVVGIVVWSLVVLALGYAIWRRRRGDEGPEREEAAPKVHRRAAKVIGIAVTASALTLVALLTASVATGRSLSNVSQEGALQIEVAGHRWWWELTFDDPQPAKRFTTANEIHVPVGKPVLLRLESRDVIHSLWIPSLNGKRDLIPGKRTQLLIRADYPGEYVGQCAEFCGTQHANMRFVVVAEAQDKFDAWVETMRAPARAPVTDEEKRGATVFVQSRCIMCHAISGTEAYATAGPDLSHVASRKTIAAGTLLNTPGHMGGWLADPQSAKPGVAMPSNALPPDDLVALVAYLGSLR